MTAPPAVALSEDSTRFSVLGAISFSHLLNDMLQSLIVAIYPLLKGSFCLNFVQIGVITLCYQLCASILQPLIGSYTDRHPQSHSLSLGMSCTLIGLVDAGLGAELPAGARRRRPVGAGSAIFHPESSRIARLCSGGRHGLAQSLFQVGGKAGSALGPLLAAWIVLPAAGRAWHGSRSPPCLPLRCCGTSARGIGFIMSMHRPRASRTPEPPAPARPTGARSASCWC